jgi:phosphoribosyl 1,2-cyclic phosphate phosphodiesterase
MENKHQLIILGSGTSTGVPTLGCHCNVCTSQNPKNKRLRSSILIITKDNKKILIDTTTDLRTQLLNNGIDDIDAAIITHEHADHTHGIDDLRPFCFYKNHPIPIYTFKNCADYLTNKFSYIFKRDEVFKDKKVLGGGIPKLDLYPVSEGSHNILGYDFEFFKLQHGHTHTLGFIFDKMAYIVDCESIDTQTLTKLKQARLNLLIIDCLRDKKHQTHLHFDQSIEYINAVEPQKAGLTHMSHDFDHNQLTKRLHQLKLNHVFPCYDQQVLDF